jgi:hypothetical protein
MKATIDVPDELYRRVKAKSALEGRAVREVAIELFSGYVGQRAPALDAEPTAAEQAAQTWKGREIPRWFGALEKYARRVESHDMDAIRESIARGISAEREL